MTKMRKMYWQKCEWQKCECQKWEKCTDKNANDKNANIRNLDIHIFAGTPVIAIGLFKFGVTAVAVVVAWGISTSP